jgi:hypothetical protein
MSRIKELKSHSSNNFNLVEFLELFSPDKKSKYTEMLLRLMKNTPNINEHAKEIKAELLKRFDFINKEDLENLQPMQTMLIYRFIDSFFNDADLINFRKFSEYNERGIVDQNDLTTYKSFEDVMLQLGLAELKAETKNLENEIIKVYENEEWLLLRPLTYLASKKYGSNTKWCTTSEGNPDYFLKYTSRGVLIYCINKKSGYKVASFCSLDKKEPEFSFWNQKDTRIDSLETELTDELRVIIREESLGKGAKTNRYLLSDEQRMKEDKVLNTKSSYKILAPEPDEVERPLRNRIQDAIRRENYEADVDVTENVTEEISESPYMGESEAVNVRRYEDIPNGQDMGENIVSENNTLGTVSRGNW